jgi:hypothetical protein
MTNSLWSRIQPHLLAAALSVLFGVLPLLITLLAAFIAGLNGCKLDEGNPHPCKVCGVEMGETLYGMGLSAWFCLLTIPAGLLMLAVNIVWLIAEIVRWALEKHT